MTCQAHHAAWSPDGDFFVCALQTKSNVSLWQRSQQRSLLTYKGHTYGVYAVDWSPDGQRIASMSQGAMIHIWDVKTGREIAVSPVYNAAATQPKSIVWSPDGSRISSIDYGRAVKVWDVTTLHHPLLTYMDHQSETCSASWSLDGRRIASADRDAKVHIWDTSTGQTIFIYTGHTASINDAQWSPSGTLIASASSDGTVQIWQVE